MPCANCSSGKRSPSPTSRRSRSDLPRATPKHRKVRTATRVRRRSVQRNALGNASAGSALQENVNGAYRDVTFSRGTIMKTSLQSPSIWSMFVASAALGAAAMFVFDPDKGRRRRALLRDKARRSFTNAARILQVSARDLGHRARGLRASARRVLARKRATDDLVLIERVRAKM